MQLKTNAISVDGEPFLNVISYNTSTVFYSMYCKSKISHAFCLDGESPDYLQYVKVPVMTNTDCNSVYSQLNFITSNMACAGYPEGGKDACQGNFRQYINLETIKTRNCQRT